jgi:hypothetical protein
MKLDLGLAIKFGWQITKANFAFFLGIIAILTAAEVAPRVVSTDVEQSSAVTAIFINLIAAIVSVVITIGITRVALKFADGIKPKFSDLYQGYSATMVVRYVLASILSALAAVGSAIPALLVFIILFAITKTTLLFIAGLPLMFIPAIYIALRLGQFRYVIVDRNAKVMESLKYSWKITKGHVGMLLLFSIKLTGIVILGILVVGIGLLWAIPTTIVASAHIYRQLENLSSVDQQAPMSE